jgi:hypothetical protein
VPAKVLCDQIFVIVSIHDHDLPSPHKAFEIDVEDFSLASYQAFFALVTVWYLSDDSRPVIYASTFARSISSSFRY